MMRSDEQMDAEAAPPRDQPASARFLNRELSWLDFNSRVLELSEDASVPLLERVKFLAIFCQNLDEFFQVRVAGLKTQVDAGVSAVSADGMTPLEQLREIRTKVLGQIQRLQDVFEKELVPELADAGFRFSKWTSLGSSDHEHLARVFREQIFPVLTPLSVDPAHPFPYISNLSLNLAVALFDPGTESHRFARVKVPANLPRFWVLPDGERFVPVEQVIAAHLDLLFPGLKIVSHNVFRVTRDADITVEEEEADDLLLAVESGLRRRRRTNAVSRLELDGAMSGQLRDLLTEELELDPEDLYPVTGTLDLGGLWALYSLDRPDLKYEPWVPINSPRLTPGQEDGSGAHIFEALRDGDVLVHHPYDSFRGSVHAFLQQAAEDPAVLAIKQTMYRTSVSEKESVAAILIRAAEAGKQVVALVELRARFDEKANIAWARRLEEAGVHVVYGMAGLKTHAKIALVVREEQGAIHRYCHVGTGNYNPETAKLYEDVGILTADPALGADLTEFFNYLTGCGRPKRFPKILFAPVTLRKAFLEQIQQEIDAGDGRIVMKMNSLVDPEIIDALYTASQAGVNIDLIVRGICCLRPGVPGMSERIRVRSILGRFLEHSRIFRFGTPERGQRYFIGSADMMPRNLDRRVEVVLPVEELSLCQRLEEILDVNLSCDAYSWELDGEARWAPVVSDNRQSAQVRLQELARARCVSDNE